MLGKEYDIIKSRVAIWKRHLCCNISDNACDLPASREIHSPLSKHSAVLGVGTAPGASSIEVVPIYKLRPELDQPIVLNA